MLRRPECSLTEFQDGIHDYLYRLAELLRSDRPVHGLGVSAWSDVAREHAITRVRLGFDVTQLFHELMALRRITHVVLGENGVGDGEEYLELIDAAIMSSLKSYIDYRDYMTRRTEAEHIGFLTHELRNPLASVALANEELAQQVDNPEQRRLVETIDRSITRLQHLIEQVLTTERFEVGEVESHPVDLALGPLLADALDVFRQRAYDKGIGLIEQYDPEQHVHADPTLTLSAIENLIDNAIKYTDVGEVTFLVEDRPGELIFHVHDQCDGLSPEELRVIFEPFRRLHSGKPGSGLGLAITKRAIETQGGTIHATSSPEAGCHFWFALPKTEH